MEGFVQKHVVGVPLTSFAYADEERRGKPSCSAMVHKKSKNLATCFPASSSSFARKKKEREREKKKKTFCANTDLIPFRSMIQIRRAPSFAG
jgi:hypothetical protein